MSNIILSTRRLRLEKIERSHLDDLYILVSNPKVQNDNMSDFDLKIKEKQEMALYNINQLSEPVLSD